MNPLTLLHLLVGASLVSACGGLECESDTECADGACYDGQCVAEDSSEVLGFPRAPQYPLPYVQSPNWENLSHVYTSTWTPNGGVVDLGRYPTTCTPPSNRSGQTWWDVELEAIYDKYGDGKINSAPDNKYLYPASAVSSGSPKYDFAVGDGNYLAPGANAAIVARVQSPCGNNQFFAIHLFLDTSTEQKHRIIRVLAGDLDDPQSGYRVVSDSDYFRHQASPQSYDLHYDNVTGSFTGFVSAYVGFTASGVKYSGTVQFNIDDNTIFNSDV